MQECPSMPVWPDYVNYQGTRVKDGYSRTVGCTTPRFFCMIDHHHGVSSELEVLALVGHAIFWNAVFGISNSNYLAEKEMTFLNSEAKLDKITMLLHEKVMFETWPYLTWPWPSLESTPKMNATIVFYVPNSPKNMRRTAHMHHLHLVTLFDQTLTLNFT